MEGILELYLRDKYLYLRDKYFTVLLKIKN
jgi:hypothetical protein